MTCAECAILLHALLDGELDAGHPVRWRHIWKFARAARPNCVLIASCSKAMPAAQLCFTAPTGLRRRIETALPAARPRTSSRLLCGSMPTKSRMRSVGIEPLAGPSAAAGLSVICETCPNDPANGGIAIGH
jgi:hypothetical protein